VTRRLVMQMHMDREAARAAIAAQATFLSAISRELQSPMQGIMSFLVRRLFVACSCNRLRTVFVCAVN
jgi:hypothetical protein